MKKVLISILTLIFIVSMITIVYAATGSISVGSSSDTVVKGKTFTVTVAGVADNNITAMQGTLAYDSTKLSIESKSAGAGFSDLSGNNEIAISATNSDNLSKSGTLYTITFKVLDTAEEGNVTISVTNTTLALVNENSEQENIKVEDDSVTVNIKSDDTTADNKDNQNNVQEEPKNTTTTPSNTTDSGNKSTVSSSSNNTTKKTTKLPQTGIENVSVIAIIALGAIGVASYVSYRKYKNI